MGRKESERTTNILLGTFGALLALYIAGVLVSDAVSRGDLAAALGAWGLVVIVVQSLFAALTGFVAASKRRSFGAWMALGFFFGLFALIAAAAVRPTGKPCSECREPIDPMARRCPHCGESQAES